MYVVYINLLYFLSIFLFIYNKNLLSPQKKQKNLRNELIRLLATRCEFHAMNIEYQMHLKLRKLANPINPPLYPPILINVDTLNCIVYMFISDSWSL